MLRLCVETAPLVVVVASIVAAGLVHRVQQTPAVKGVRNICKQQRERLFN